MKNEKPVDALKKENYKERKPDLGIAGSPKQKLSQEERVYLTELLLDRVAYHYEQTARTLGVLNDFEKRTHGANVLQSDAYNDGVLAFYRCLDKFDKKRYEGKISDNSIFGSDQPKKLEFYFFVFAKKTITENLLDDLKISRGRKVITSIDNAEEDFSEDYVPTTEERESNVHELFLKLINGFGGESHATKILAKECNQDYELIWYIFTSKVEGIRAKNIVIEMLEKDSALGDEIMKKVKNEEELTNSERDLFQSRKETAKARLKSLEARTIKIFNKIRQSTSRDM